MKFHHKYSFALIIGFALLTACTPKATPTPVDLIGTRSAELAASMLTQTVAAYSPTPLPPTATPAFTITPAFTATPAKIDQPRVTGYAPCYKNGPGKPGDELVSNISDYKLVEIVGIGSVTGWYVIINPYFHSKCWIAAENLVLDPNFDLSAYPTMTK